MRVLAFALLAGASIAVATPVAAQDVYVGGRTGGVGVGVDVRHDRDFDRDRDRDHRAFGYERGFQRCSTTIIREGGMVKKIRRCRGD